MKSVEEIRNLILNERGNLKFSIVNKTNGIDKKFPEIWNEIIEATSFLDKECSITERLYVFLNELKENDVKCAICHKGIRPFKNFSVGYTGKTCSFACGRKQSALSYKEHNPIHHTKTIEFKEARKKRTLEKYGVESYFQTEEFKETFKEHNLEKYGVESINSAEIVKEKKKKVFLERYGVENPNQVKEIVNRAVQTKKEKYGNGNNYEKIKATCLEKYGVEFQFQRRDIIDKTKKEKLFPMYLKFCKTLKKTKNVECLSAFEDYKASFYGENILLTYKCHNCEKIFESTERKVNKILCSCTKWLSKPEKEIGDWLESLGYLIERKNRKLLHGKEIDLFLPDYNLALEYNGSYRHSIEFKDKLYHQQKVKDCIEEKFSLIHIFEHEWKNRKHVVKDFILRRLKPIEYATYKINEISLNQAKEFIQFHSTMRIQKMNTALGLFNSEHKLIDCSGLNGSSLINITGSEKYFIEHLHPISVIIDAHCSNILEFKNLGFEIRSWTEPLLLEAESYKVFDCGFVKLETDLLKN